jgi:hypothetical protein
MRYAKRSSSQQTQAGWISSPKPGSYLSRLGRMLADLRIDGHWADRNIDVNFSDNRTFEK